MVPQGEPLCGFLEREADKTGIEGSRLLVVRARLRRCCSCPCGFVTTGGSERGRRRARSFPPVLSFRRWPALSGPGRHWLDSRELRYNARSHAGIANADREVTEGRVNCSSPTSPSSRRTVLLLCQALRDGSSRCCAWHVSKQSNDRTQRRPREGTSGRCRQTREYEGYAGLAPAVQGVASRAAHA